jgi:hypothetical protein
MQATINPLVLPVRALDSIAKCAYELIVDAYSGIDTESSNADQFASSVKNLESAWHRNENVELSIEYCTELVAALRQASTEALRRQSLTKRSARKLCKLLADLPRQAENEELGEESIWGSFSMLASTTW